MWRKVVNCILDSNSKTYRSWTLLLPCFRCLHPLKNTKLGTNLSQFSLNFGTSDLLVAVFCSCSTQNLPSFLVQMNGASTHTRYSTKEQLKICSHRDNTEISGGFSAGGSKKLSNNNEDKEGRVSAAKRGKRVTFSTCPSSRTHCFNGT